jgi:hypothetical protein
MGPIQPTSEGEEKVEGGDEGVVCCQGQAQPGLVLHRTELARVYTVVTT